LGSGVTTFSLALAGRSGRTLATARLVGTVFCEGQTALRRDLSPAKRRRAIAPQAWRIFGAVATDHRRWTIARRRCDRRRIEVGLMPRHPVKPSLPAFALWRAKPPGASQILHSAFLSLRNKTKPNVSQFAISFRREGKSFRQRNRKSLILLGPRNLGFRGLETFQHVTADFVSHPSP